MNDSVNFNEKLKASDLERMEGLGKDEYSENDDSNKNSDTIMISSIDHVSNNMMKDSSWSRLLDKNESRH